MKLKYSILWVENDPDWAESIEDDIKDYVEQQGFVFDKTLIRQKQDDLDYNQYDLILMDLNLASTPMGNDLINQIRDLGVYTDVVFYSASGIENIKTIGRAQNLEGVYYSGRNETLFVKKVTAVIATTIKKVQDLNNLRGLVMAEVSDLDAMMHTIVKAYFTTEERMTVFHDKITKDREKSFKKMLVYKGEGDCGKRCEHKWKELTINEIVDHMDASQLAHAIKIIVNDEKIFHYDSYLNEIINVRNDLAHCESKIEDGKEILRTRKGDVYFDEPKFVEIRRNIKKYHNLFEEMLQKVQ